MRTLLFSRAKGKFAWAENIFPFICVHQCPSVVDFLRLYLSSYVVLQLFIRLGKWLHRHLHAGIYVCKNNGIFFNVNNLI